MNNACVPKVIQITMISALLVSGLAAAEQLNEAKVCSKDKFIRFKKSQNVYCGEAEIYFHSIPNSFKGYKVSLRCLCSPKPLKFQVKEAGVVRIITAGIPVSRLLSEGWAEIDSLQFETPSGEVRDRALILERNLAVGQYSIPSEGNFGIRLLKR